MRFENIYMSWFLWLLVLLGAFFVWSFRKKRSVIKRFVDKRLFAALADSFSIKRGVLKNTLLFLVFFFSIIALMRPQWGFRWEEVKMRGRDILIAIDISKSMLANDIKPSRLERTKLAVGDFVKELKGDRVGLIAFSGTAFLQCPLTVDYGGFLLSLKELDTSIIPLGGTSISDAIRVVMHSFEVGTEEEKILVIITDGEDHSGQALELAKESAKKNIKIFCIGVGTREGELIQTQDESGHKEFLKNREGNVVKTRLNEDLLESIALATGGAYVRSSGSEFGLRILYDQRLAKIEEKEFKSKMKKVFHERFQFPLAVALILILAESVIGAKKNI